MAASGGEARYLLRAADGRYLSAGSGAEGLELVDRECHPIAGIDDADDQPSERLTALAVRPHCRRALAIGRTG